MLSSEQVKRVKKNLPNRKNVRLTESSATDPTGPWECAGCGTQLTDAESIFTALERRWHTCCFRCKSCDSVLRDEFIERDGIPYCEKDYNRMFGVKCVQCSRFITGKVLQAGNCNHFHLTCGRCFKCGETFADGELLYVQGTVIWHPRCGPPPVESSLLENGYYTDDDKSDSIKSCDNKTRHSDQKYLKKIIDPYDKPATNRHFHLPFNRQPKRRNLSETNDTDYLERGIKAPHSKSPRIPVEGPVQLARIPDAKKPQPGEEPKIERDDFPAPPCLYATNERRNRPYKLNKCGSDEEAINQEPKNDGVMKCPKELGKTVTGMGKILLEDLHRRELLKRYKQQHLDPRNSSRVPSAGRELSQRFRYQRPVHASPSRYTTPPRSWQKCNSMDRSSNNLFPTDKHSGTRSCLNVQPTRIKLGKFFTSPAKGKTLPWGRCTSGYSSDYEFGVNGDFSFPQTKDKARHMEPNSGKSDISSCSLSDGNNGTRYVYKSYIPRLRCSLSTISRMSSDPPKTYPYHLLVTTNYRLPQDVDRCNLERHLSNKEFVDKFQCGRQHFYSLPKWKRDEIKKRLKLF